MHKLCKLHNINVYATFRNPHKIPKFLPPISHSHTSSKTHNPAAGDSLPSDRREAAVRISHPSPEWVDLMEVLAKRGYFGDDGLLGPFGSGEMGTKETNLIRTACLNFARDRFGLIRFLSRKDIQVIVGYGCPILDRKVVNSGKRLRAHVGINEGNVCSICNLRGDCERAYVKAREHENGRTVDVMRILLTYGLDSLSGILENKACENKTIKESTRRLLKEIVEFSDRQLDSDLPNGAPLKPDGGHINVPMKQGDWHCPKCNFLNFARNVKCLRCNGLFQERLKQLSEDHDRLPLKKGDWICERCNFLNFAKNTRCLQCEAKPPKRHLNPGEWECDSCNYINFRRNMVCLKCDYKRPKASKSLKTSTYPKDDYGELRTIESKRANQSKGADTWRFVDEEREDNDSFSCDEDCGFVDFPITGGMSSLSRDAEKREKWVRDMLKRSKSPARRKERGEEFMYANTPRLQYLESTDDEDVAEWFRNENESETEVCVSAPEKVLD